MSEMSIDFAIKMLASASVNHDNQLAPDYTYSYYDKARRLAIKVLKDYKDRQDNREVLVKLPCNVEDVCYTLTYGDNEGEILIQDNIVKYFEISSDNVITPYGKRKDVILGWGDSYQLISGLDGKVYYDKSTAQLALIIEKNRNLDD